MQLCITARMCLLALCTVSHRRVCDMLVLCSRKPTNNAAEELRQHVEQSAAPGHVAADHGAQRDSGVEVPPRQICGGVHKDRQGQAVAICRSQEHMSREGDDVGRREGRQADAALSNYHAQVPHAVARNRNAPPRPSQAPTCCSRVACFAAVERKQQHAKELCRQRSIQLLVAALNVAALAKLRSRQLRQGRPMRPE